MTPLRIVLAVAVAGCASAPRPTDPGHDRPLSVVEHIEEAERHDGVARAHDHAPRQDVLGAMTPENLQCVDRPLAGMTYSGGEPVRVMRPCWSAHQGPSEHDLATVELHVRAAAQHRAQAAALMRAERTACAGLGEEEISHGPFYHRADVVSVREADGGVHVSFRDVPGLTADWMRRSIECERTRAAVMGYSLTFNSYSPLALAGAVAAVDVGEAGLVVTLRADDPEIAAEISRRALALVAPADSGATH